MDFTEYQQLALRTAGARGTEAQFVYSALGLVCEAGEYGDHVKKIVYHGRPLTDIARWQMQDELGDVLWYLSVAADAAGLTLDDIAVGNVEKLRKRYPDGFSSERSVQRQENGPTEPTGSMVTTGVWEWYKSMECWRYNGDNGYIVIRAAVGPRRPWLMYVYDKEGNEQYCGSSPSIDDAKSASVRHLSNLAG